MLLHLKKKAQTNQNRWRNKLTYCCLPDATDFFVETKIATSYRATQTRQRRCALPMMASSTFIWRRTAYLPVVLPLAVQTGRHRKKTRDPNVWREARVGICNRPIIVVTVLPTSQRLRKVVKQCACERREVRRQHILYGEVF